MLYHALKKTIYTNHLSRKNTVKNMQLEMCPWEMQNFDQNVPFTIIFFVPLSDSAVYTRKMVHLYTHLR